MVAYNTERLCWIAVSIYWAYLMYFIWYIFIGYIWTLTIPTFFCLIHLRISLSENPLNVKVILHKLNNTANAQNILKNILIIQNTWKGKLYRYYFLTSRLFLEYKVSEHLLVATSKVFLFKSRKILWLYSFLYLLQLKVFKQVTIIVHQNSFHAVLQDFPAALFYF